MDGKVFHVGFFPFCIGVEEDFRFEKFIITRPPNLGQISQISEPAYNAVFKMSITDAMALYWKATSAVLRVNWGVTSYSGLPNVGPIFIQRNINEEIPFYREHPEKNEKMKERVCFDEELNEPLLAYNEIIPTASGMGDFSFYCSFFTDTHKLNEKTSRVFLQEAGTFYPDKEVYVNIDMRLQTSLSYYSNNIVVANFPHQSPFNGFTDVQTYLNLNINDNEYRAEVQGQLGAADFAAGNYLDEIYLDVTV